MDGGVWKICLLGIINYISSEPDPFDTVNININLGEGTNKDISIPTDSNYDYGQDNIDLDYQDIQDYDYEQDKIGSNYWHRDKGYGYEQASEKNTDEIDDTEEYEDTNEPDGTDEIEEQKAIVDQLKHEKENECVIENNMNYVGFNIKKKIPSEGAQDCARWCSVTNNCTFWTLDKRTNDCWLKYNHTGENNRTDNKKISGSKICGGLRKCFLEDRTRYEDNDIRNLIVKEKGGRVNCMNYCGKYYGCNYWTYKSSNKQCFLKTSDAGRIPDGGFDSGSKSCSTCNRFGLKCETVDGLE